MRVDICQETDPRDATLELPWADPCDPERRYRDLKTCPAAILELEECRRYPVLGEFLRQVNSPESALRTVKCDVWTTTELAEDEQLDFGLPHKVGSYIDLLFDRPNLNSRVEPQLLLARKIEESVKSQRAQAQIEVCVRRCLFHPEERWGYYLTIFTHAYGASPQEADDQWNRAVGALAEAWAGIDRDFRSPAMESSA